MFEYQNGVLEFVQTAEGRATPSGSVYSYDYMLKDHLGNTRVLIKQNGSILDINDYYAFGLEIGDPMGPSPDNNYKYNGKEWNNDLSLNAYDYGARFYDPIIGRWNMIDGKAEKYVSLSPYHYAGNNPIRNYDIDGNEFTDPAQKYVDRLMEDINSRQASNNTSISQKQKQLSAGGLSERQANRLNRQIGNLQSNNTQLDGVKGEISVLSASSQVYNVVESSSQNGPNTNVGVTAFNFATKAVDITISSSAGNALFAHELKHAYQFETSESSLGAIGTLGKELLLDKTDEYAGYERQNLFSPSGYGYKNLPSSYNGLPEGPTNYRNYNKLSGFQDAVSSGNAVQLNNAARITNQAFRINGVIYSGK